MTACGCGQHILLQAKAVVTSGNTVPPLQPVQPVMPATQSQGIIAYRTCVLNIALEQRSSHSEPHYVLGFFRLPYSGKGFILLRRAQNKILTHENLDNMIMCSGHTTKIRP